MQSIPRGARTTVWALPISLAATFGIEFSFSSSGYLDVSVHRVPSRTLCIYVRVPEVFSGGFPHSEIDGSFRICRSPSLIAAYHVFLRLLVPRHPPYALNVWPIYISFDISSTLAWINVGCVFGLLINNYRSSPSDRFVFTFDSFESGLFYINFISLPLTPLMPRMSYSI